MYPINKNTLEEVLQDLHIPQIEKATIRQISSLAGSIEEKAGEKMIHLELGNPGLPAEQVGVEAEIKALRMGMANQYPNIIGIPDLKKNGARFVKAFLDVDLDPMGVVPTVGSMQASFTLMMILKQRCVGKDTLLMLYPGFSAQRNQAKLVGMNLEGFDMYDYRGKKLEARLEEIFKTGRISAMIYSNPNNPAWTNFTEEELEIIGRLATKYDVIVVEDLAYLGMDFRKDFSHPYESPFIPSVAKYTDNYILLISASKIFSYAGQRIAMVCMSPSVFNREYDTLDNFYDLSKFGDAYIYGVLYCASSGTAHSAQYALAGMLEAAVEGKLDFVDHTREYGRRGGKIKKLFKDNGFELVYKFDGDEEVSDGFFMTVKYGDLNSVDLQKELLRYGVATVSLPGTGSLQHGVRVTVSNISDKRDFDILADRLENFNKEHKA